MQTHTVTKRITSALSVAALAGTLTAVAAGAAGADDEGYTAADTGAIADQVAIDSACLFDAGSLGHPNPIVACRADAIDNAGR